MAIHPQHMQLRTVADPGGGQSGHAPLGAMAGLAIVILYVDIINVFLLLWPPQ